MKGVSKFITYTLTILFGFMIITFFTTMIYGYYDRTIKSNIRIGLKQIAIHTSSSIMKLFELSEQTNVQPENMTSFKISEINLNYPLKISGRNYEVNLIASPGIWNQIHNITIDGKSATVIKEIKSNAKVVVKTTQRPFLSYEYDVSNIPIVLQGKFRSGDNDIIRLIRFNYNGNMENRIILGESDLIIGVTNIS